MAIIVLKVLIALVFIFMLLMNYLSNAKPLNKRSQKIISDDYPALFTPSSYAFSIWGIIYVLIAVFVVKTIMTDHTLITGTYLESVMIIFVVTSLLNVLWLLLWHYDYISLSSLVMISLLVLNVLTVHLIPLPDLLLKITFSFYSGWLMVALVANLSINLVKYKINVFLKNEVAWYLVVITLGLLIVSLVLLLERNVITGLVFTWAYLAIFIKHLTKQGCYLKTKGPLVYTGIILGLITSLTFLTFMLNGFNLFS